jgi:hypothetical protein
VSSEHVTEQVPLAEIREGDMPQDPKSGNWIEVVQTADGTTNATRRCSDGERTVVEQYRVYYGDGGEEIDSRFVKGLVTRHARSSTARQPFCSTGFGGFTIYSMLHESSYRTTGFVATVHLTVFPA